MSDDILLERFAAHKEFTRIFLDSYVLVNAEGRIIEFNKWFCSLVGVKSSRLRHKTTTLSELMHFSHPGSPEIIDEQILRSQEPTRFDEIAAQVVSGDKEGETLQLVIGTFPYVNPEGEYLGVCLMLRDVTAETLLQNKYDDKKTLSITDSLTGLYTRRFFEEWIDQELDYSRRLGIDPALGILMFDLDKFKSINDTYGHLAGDYVLMHAARTIQGALRKSDIVGRYGGEEIIVVLPGASSVGIVTVAEKIRKQIAEENFVFEGTRIRVTTSVGATSFRSRDEARKDVISRADSCLYKAKESGRNTVFCSFGERLVMGNEFLRLQRIE